VSVQHDAFADTTTIGYYKTGDLGLRVYGTVMGNLSSDLDSFSFALNGQAENVVFLVDGERLVLSDADGKGGLRLSRQNLQRLAVATVILGRLAGREINLTSEDRNKFGELLQKTTRDGFSVLLQGIVAGERRERQQRQLDTENAGRELAAAHAELRQAWNDLPRRVDQPPYRYLDNWVTVSYSYRVVDQMGCVLSAQAAVTDWTGDTRTGVEKEGNTATQDGSGRPTHATYSNGALLIGGLKGLHSFVGSSGRQTSEDNYFAFEKGISAGTQSRIESAINRIIKACTLLNP
jgi:hypothetical protein